MRGNPGSERSQRAPVCAVGVPGVPPRPPGTSGTPLAGRAAAAPPASLRGGGEGSAGVKGHVSPPPRPAENVFQLPRGNARKKKRKKNPPPQASGWRFCFCYCQGRGTKSKTFYIRMWPHTVPHSVPSSGRFGTNRVPPSARPRSGIMKQRLLFYKPLDLCLGNSIN